MKIALAQIKMNPDMESNYKKSIQYIEAAGSKGADMICFPEIQLSPFFPQYRGIDAGEFALTLDSEYIKGICDTCKENRIYAVPNFYVEENGRRYDMSILVDNAGNILGKQKMVHIAQCERFYEQDYYTPSEEGFSVFDTPFGKIGIVVCFDRHYPESIRTEALMGAELIVIPTANTKAEPSEMFLWEIKVQAFLNSANIAMVNRIGTEGEMVFSGESVVSDYNGDITMLAGDSEELLIAEVDLSGASKTRNQKPYTSLRRPDLYV